MDYNNYLNPTLVSVKPSGIRKFFSIAEEMDDVISLGVGEPDFKTPWSVRDAGIRSLELSAGMEEQEDGSLLYAVDGSMETLADMPEELLLVPFQYDADSRRVYDWDRAIPVCLQ